MDKYKLVSDLIIRVLTSKISVSQALSNFPKDSKDINLKCAFDALVHYEADEDIRAKVEGYAQIQDEYLECIANTLAKGKPIPNNIAKRYLQYHNDNLISDNKNDIKNIANYLKRMINF